MLWQRRSSAIIDLTQTADKAYAQPMLTEIKIKKAPHDCPLHKMFARCCKIDIIFNSAS